MRWINLRPAVVLLFICISGALLRAQDVGITYGDEADFEPKKGMEALSLSAGGNTYFVSRYTENLLLNYAVYSYNAQGDLNYYKTLDLNPGVFNNTYEINKVLAFGNSLYAMVVHVDKPAGKNSVLARIIDNSGVIATAETEIMSFPFEKTMNAGTHYLEVSPSNSVLGVASEMPFEKDQPAKIKYATYDPQLKKMKAGEITLPGENTKNKSMQFAVADNGTLYLLKKTMSKNGEMMLTVYQWSAGFAEVIEYAIDMAAPEYITGYTYTVLTDNTLIVCGTYYQRKTVTAGDPQTSGIFYFTNSNLSEKKFRILPLDAPVENLVAQDILINGNTIFLAMEQFKEEKEITTTTTTSLTPDYNYQYTHKSDFIIGMDMEGNKKFQLEVSKQFSSRNFDEQYATSYSLCNGKLTLLFNDEKKKYLPGVDYGILPVMVQITNDGLMQAPVLFTDKLELDGGYPIYPVFSKQQGTDQVAIALGKSKAIKWVSLQPGN